MQTLYHYSSLLHLPPILKDGLLGGEIARLNYGQQSAAVSLTTQTDRRRLYLWGQSTLIETKTAVRYECKIAVGDVSLEAARDVWKKLKMTPQTIKSLDPNGQSKWWYFYHGKIMPELLKIELWGRDGYVPASTHQLSQIASEVGQLREKFEFIIPPNEPWALNVRLKDPKDKTPLWVLEETSPADRYPASS